MASVSEIHETLYKFGWLDYVVLAIVFLCSLIVGLYFGWQNYNAKKISKDVVATYLVAGRKMHVFPVAMSLIASFVSGISLIGYSTEMYVYGTQFCYVFIGVFLMGIVVHFVYLPVYHDLQLTSTYEYLALRFNNKCRLFGSLMFFTGHDVLAPNCLLFSGVGIHIITPLVFIIGIIYTSIGGIKGVMWTDALQIFVMLGSILLVAYMGTIEVGGISTVFKHGFESGRIEGPNFSFDPTVRVTFWSCVVGGTVHWIGTNGIHQTQIQRYFSLNSLEKARTALWIFIIGCICILSISMYNGLLLYATFHDCDPLTTKLATAKDQLMPLLVIKALGKYPGAAGLFVAGVLSAALSTFSTILNSLAAVTLQDFIKPHFPKLNEKSVEIILRASIVVFGVAAIGMVFVVEKLGAILQISAVTSGMSLGPLIGLFSLGLFFPWIHSNAALIGSIISFLINGILCTRAQIQIYQGYIDPSVKPTSVENCDYEYDNSTLMESVIKQNQNIESHQIAFYYYALFGMVLTVAGAHLAGFLIGFQEPDVVHYKLLAPFIRKLVKRKQLVNIEKMEMDEEEVIKLQNEND